MPPQTNSLKLIVNNDSLIVPGVEPVDIHSSDDDIVAAIDLAGSYIAAVQPSHREWDWREDWDIPKFVYRIRRFAFVQPSDISDDTRMYLRLKQMIKEGKLSGNFATGTHVRVARNLKNPEDDYRPHKKIRA